MYCVNCGDPIRPNANFCTKCGAKARWDYIQKSETDNKPNQSRYPQYPNLKLPPRKRKTITTDSVRQRINADDYVLIESASEAATFERSHVLLEEIRSRVVGVSFRNDDGSNRQSILSHCHCGDPVTLAFYSYEGEPACAVITDHGQIGNLAAELAGQIKRAYSDCLIGGEILQVTGGDQGRYLGCNILIKIYQDK